MQCAAKNQFGSGMCIKGLNQGRTEKGRVKSKISDILSVITRNLPIILIGPFLLLNGISRLSKF